MFPGTRDDAPTSIRGWMSSICLSLWALRDGWCLGDWGRRVRMRVLRVVPQQMRPADKTVYLSIQCSSSIWAERILRINGLDRTVSPGAPDFAPLTARHRLRNFRSATSPRLVTRASDDESRDWSCCDAHGDVHSEGPMRIVIASCCVTANYGTCGCGAAAMGSTLQPEHTGGAATLQRRMTMRAS